VLYTERYLFMSSCYSILLTSERGSSYQTQAAEVSFFYHSCNTVPCLHTAVAPLEMALRLD